MSVVIPAGLVTNEAGLLPVVVQDRASGDVLMVAWANAEALARTAETGFAHFWSRSRRTLWRKGETSGNGLRVVGVRTDCDRDVLLLVVEPQGPACHTGTRTCFGEDSPTAAGTLEELMRSPANGSDRKRKQTGEEPPEIVFAARGKSDERLLVESADLLQRLLEALQRRGLPLARVMDELRRRRSAE